jgi:hypothetical protein
MSIATLKRKTLTQYHNMSAGSKNGGFSLNGTHRSQGYIGQSMLSRAKSLPVTNYKNGVPKGHGGCCGKFPRKLIMQNSTFTTENPAVVKPSVLTNSGLISTKYRWIRRGKLYANVKPKPDDHFNSQGLRIELLRRQALFDEESCKNINKNVKYGYSKCGGLKGLLRPQVCFFNVENKHRYIPQSERIMQLLQQCVDDNDDIHPPKNTSNTPFACRGFK